VVEAGDFQLQAEGVREIDAAAHRLPAVEAARAGRPFP
jgi:hypothetical protein